MAKDIYLKHRARDTRDARSIENLTKLRIKDLVQLKERWEESLTPPHPAQQTNDPGLFVDDIADETPHMRREDAVSQQRPKRKRLEPVITRRRASNTQSGTTINPATEGSDQQVQHRITRRELQLKEECELDGWIIDEGQTAEPPTKLLFTRPSLLLSKIDRTGPAGRQAFSELLEKFMELIVAASAASDEYPVSDAE